MRLPKLCLGLVLVAPWVAGCNDTTGGARIKFRAAAAGPNADPADIATFVNRLGFDVTLTQAVLHIGAIYLNESNRISTADDQFGCFGGGRDVGQVLAGPDGMDVNLLSPDPQFFSVIGEGTESRVHAASIWLTGRQPISVVQDPQPILTIAGLAQRGGIAWPFVGAMPINHLTPSPSPATPGINPICKRRIVAPVPVNIPLLQDGGLLLLRLDPYDLFVGTDFSSLPPPVRSIYQFEDRSDIAADQNVYAGLSTATNYIISWQPPEGRSP